MSDSRINVVVAAVACFQLFSSSTFSLMKESYLSLGILDQLALVALATSLVYSAIFVSSFIGNEAEDGHADHDHDAPFMYPLKEIQSKITDKEKFATLFPPLRDSIVNIMADDNDMPPEAVAWAIEMMEYTCRDTKLNRGTMVLSVIRTLAAPRELKPLEEARACVLGWAVELFQAFFLVADDLMVEKRKRRDKPCWYRLPQVGTIAVNDSFMLGSFVFSFLTKHFQEETYYEHLLELFLEVQQQTIFGKLLDLTLQSQDSTTIDFSKYTMERYKTIVKNKTAMYSFYLPMAIGMIVNDVQDEISLKRAKRICCTMGEFFQVQDDYLDCYGTPDVIGKVGTDIQDNEYSWLIVKALSLATPEQRNILQDNYGKSDEARVAKVKNVYNEMDLKSLFEKYEEDSYNEIQEELQKLTSMPTEVFTLLLDKIYKKNQ